MKTYYCHNILKCLFVSFVIVTIAGCASGNRASFDSGLESSEPVAKKLTITVQENAHSNTLRSMIRKYERTHPDVKVEIVRLPSDRYEELLHMLMTSGEGPDLFHASTRWMATYLYKNWLLDLSDWVELDLLAEYPRWAVDYTRTNSRFYALPSELTTLRLVYNKELFRHAGLNPEAPPETLSDLRDYAIRISQAGQGYRIYGFALPAGENETLHQALEAGSTRSGHYYYRYEDGVYDFSVYLPWFETILEMKQEGGVFPGETSLSMDTALTQFAEGYIGMMYMTNRDFFALTQSMEDHSSLGVALPPVYSDAVKDNGALMLTLQAPLVVHNHTEYRTEAVDLWKTLHTEAFQDQLFREDLSIPVRRMSVMNAETDRALSSFQPIGQESPYPQEPKFILENRSVDNFANLSDSLRMGAYRDILLGITAPEEALNSLSGQYNRSLENAIYRGLINMEHYIYPEFDPLQPIHEIK
jgi:multiple sugar transport system substrate-binding protein